MAVHRNSKPGIGAVARWTANKPHTDSPLLPPNPSLAISDLLSGTLAVDTDDYVVVRIPRSILNHALAQEYHHMSNNTASIPTATVPAADVADALRARLIDLDRQRNETAEQFRAVTGNDIAGTAAIAQQKGRQNLAKTVGKYSAITAGVGVLTAAGVYAYRAWKLTRG